MYPGAPQIPAPMPPDKSGYPTNWFDIAHALKSWAEWKCEVCFHLHDPDTGYCLTVHHLDGNPLNNDWHNLLVCCQRCHLYIQAVYKPGQLWLMGAPIWAFIRQPEMSNLAALGTPLVKSQGRPLNIAGTPHRDAP